MKKLLIIALLFWGCEFAPTEHTHEHEHDTTHEHDDIYGCTDSTSTNFDSTATIFDNTCFYENHPLVGRWEKTKYEEYKPSIDVPDYWVLNDTTSYVVGEIHPVHDSLYLYYEKIFEFYSNGTFVSWYSSDTTQNNYGNQNTSYHFEGVWFINEFFLTFTYEYYLNDTKDYTFTHKFEFENSNEFFFDFIFLDYGTATILKKAKTTYKRID